MSSSQANGDAVNRLLEQQIGQLTALQRQLQGTSQQSRPSQVLAPPFRAQSSTSLPTTTTDRLRSTLSRMNASNIRSEVSRTMRGGHLQDRSAFQRPRAHPYRRSSQNRASQDKPLALKLTVYDYMGEVLPDSVRFDGQPLATNCALTLMKSWGDELCQQEIMSVVKRVAPNYTGTYEFVQRESKWYIARVITSPSFKADASGIWSIRSKHENKIMIRLNSPSGNPDPHSYEDDMESVGPMVVDDESAEQPQRETTRLFEGGESQTNIPVDDNDTDESSVPSPSRHAPRSNQIQKTFREATKGHCCEVLDPRLTNIWIKNVGNACAMTAVIVVMQFIKDFCELTAVLEHETSGDASDDPICNGVAECLAVRGCSDTSIVRQAAINFMTAIGMKDQAPLNRSGVKSDFSEIFENMLMQLTSSLSTDSSRKIQQIFEGTAEGSLESSTILRVQPESSLLTVEDLIRKRLLAQTSDSESNGTPRKRWTEEPTVLVVWIERVSLTQQGKKDNREVIVNKTLHVDCLFHPEKVIPTSDDSTHHEYYFLKALVVHSEIRDHYYCMVNFERKWLLIDDDKVTHVDMDSELWRYLEGGRRNDSIVCAFYERQDSRSFTRPHIMAEETIKTLTARLKDEAVVSLGRPHSPIVVEDETQQEISDDEVNVENEFQDLEKKIKNVLNDVEGMNEIKEQMQTFARGVIINKIRETHGVKMSQDDLGPLNFLFYGNPGTGKTMIARKMAVILKHLKLTRKAKTVEVQRDDLLGEHIGETERKTADVIRSAQGGVLFVDEAYQLVNESKQDFGRQAINTIMKYMNRDSPSMADAPIIIMAGYAKEMDQVMKSNPGLKRRFREPFVFSDYSPSTLASILEKLILSKHFSQPENICFEEYFARVNADIKSFYNAALCKKVFSKAVENLNNRIALNSFRISETLRFQGDDFKKAFEEFSTANNQSLRKTRKKDMAIQCTPNLLQLRRYSSPI